MRCPDCNKFVGNDLQEPEVDLSLDGTVISGMVRIVNCCAECGGELTEANFDIDEDIGEQPDHDGDGHELSLADDTMATDRMEGKGRGLRTFYGFSTTYYVTCSCQKPDDKPISEGVIEDDIQASAMDSLV